MSPPWRPFLGAFVLLAIAASLAPAAYGARGDYVGPTGCKDCHEPAFAIWEASAHARADQVLGPAPEPRCLACHATGEAPAGRTFFSGVTCESCHGPGRGYAQDDIMRDRFLALRLGMRDLSTPDKRAALCAECHAESTRLSPFDPERAYQRIEHPTASQTASQTANPSDKP